MGKKLHKRDKALRPLDLPISIFLVKSASRPSSDIHFTMHLNSDGFLSDIDGYLHPGVDGR